MEKLLSVIVPCYNVEKSLARCLDSVLKLDCDKEIIVVNDGSKDNTAEVIRKYEGKQEIKAIHQENQGLSGARNTGLKAACGKWILFIDSDDYLDDNIDIKNILNSDDVDLISFGFKRVSENGEVLSTRIQNSKRPWVLITAWSRFYKRSFLTENNIQFEPGIIYEDTLYAVKLYKCNPKIKTLDTAFYNYVVNPNSITSKPHETKTIFRHLKKQHISIFDCNNLLIRLRVHFIKERLQYIKSKLTKRK